MFGLGWQETAVIFMLALLLFGPKKLPELGKNLAKALGEFRRASNELKDTWHREMAAVERETQDIKKEAESLNQTVATSYPDSTYNYDYNYEYGGYGYPESTEASAQPAAEAAGGEAASTEVAAAEPVADSIPEMAPDITPEVAETAAGPSDSVADSVRPEQASDAAEEITRAR